MAEESAVEALKARLAAAQAEKGQQEAVAAADQTRSAEIIAERERMALKNDAKLRSMLPETIENMRTVVTDAKARRDQDITNYKGSHKEIDDLAKGLEAVGDTGLKAKYMVTEAREEIRSGNKDTLMANQDSWKSYEATAKSLEELAGVIDLLTPEEKAAVVSAIENGEPASIAGLGAEVKERVKKSEETAKEAAKENFEVQKKELEIRHEKLTEKWEAHKIERDSFQDKRNKMRKKILDVAAKVDETYGAERVQYYKDDFQDRVRDVILILNSGQDNIAELEGFRKINNVVPRENKALLAEIDKFNSDLLAFSRASGDTVKDDDGPFLVKNRIGNGVADALLWLYEGIQALGEKADVGEHDGYLSEIASRLGLE